MDLLKAFLKFAGFGLISLSFLSLFFGIALVLAPYELDDLQNRINTEYPAKVAAVLDATMPELSQLSLNDVKLGCMARALGMINSTEQLPLSEADLDIICSEAGSAASIAQLKEKFVSIKLKATVDDVFADIKGDYIEPYSNAYIALSFIISFAFFAIAAVVLYFSESGIFEWLRTISFHVFLESVFYVIGFVASWLLFPSVVGSMLSGNEQISGMFAQLPAEQQPIAENFMLDAADFIMSWLRNALLHFIIIFAVIGAIGFAAWAGTSLFAAGTKTKSA